MPRFLRALQQRISRFIHRKQVAFVLKFAREQRWVVIDSDQLERARLYLYAEERRVTRMGGGNASKFRQPRHTLRRLLRRLDRNLGYLQQTQPEVSSYGEVMLAPTKGAV